MRRTECSAPRELSTSAASTFSRKDSLFVIGASVRQRRTPAADQRFTAGRSAPWARGHRHSVRSAADQLTRPWRASAAADIVDACDGCRRPGISVRWRGLVAAYVSRPRRLCRAQFQWVVGADCGSGCVVRQMAGGLRAVLERPRSGNRKQAHVPFDQVRILMCWRVAVVAVAGAVLGAQHCVAQSV